MRTPRHSPVTVRAARWSATHPWRAIALWLVFVAGAVAIGGSVATHDATTIDQLDGQSKTAARWVHDAGLERPDTENVLVTARHGRLDTALGRQALADVRTRMRALTDVRSVGAIRTSPNRRAMTVQLTLRHRDDPDPEPLLRQTAAVQGHYPELRVEQAGDASVNKAVDDLVGRDLAQATEFSLPVTLVILLVAFGAILAAGVPVLLALSAVAAATGLTALSTHVIPGADTTSSMILLMGMAVGVDYSLFYVKRARAERHRGRSALDAVEIAAQTAGHSVLVSGLAVLVAMAGLFLAGDATFAALATGSMIVVAVAVLGSLTVLPALLIKLGRAIDRPRVPVVWRLTAADRTPRVWPRLINPALHHPVRTLVITVVGLLAVAAPALGMHLQSGSAVSLPGSLPEKHTIDRLYAAFPDTESEATVVVRAPASSAADVGRALRALDRDAATTRLFLAGPPSVQASPDATVHVLTVDAPFDPESAPARHGVELLRTQLVPRALDRLPSVHWAVGGDTAENVDIDRHLADRLPWVIGFVVLLTMLIMGWVFRSAAIALGTAVVNLLSAGTAFGVLTLVFQHRWAESLLGFPSTGRLINWIPLFTFAVLFGLSMDYHVFVISRIREAAARGLDKRAAIRAGLLESAGTVTSAALVMVSVFAIFASLHLIELKELGIGLAVAVLVDALVVRVVVLPALLMLLGGRVLGAAAAGSGDGSGGSGLGQRHGAVDHALALEQRDLRDARVG